MSGRFVRLHACDPLQPGLRLRLEREDDEIAQLVSETTLPERVNSENAQRVERHEQIWLTAVEARWLHDALGELLPSWEAQNARDQAALDARAKEQAEQLGEIEDDGDRDDDDELPEDREECTCARGPFDGSDDVGFPCSYCGRIVR